LRRVATAIESASLELLEPAMKKHLLPALLLFALTSSRVWASPTEKHTLPNGLTVLVHEDHSAPVVAVRFYVRTGSIYEDKYLGAGLSHLFEHTLFEGTTDKNHQQIDDELQAIGGVSNAYTSYDVTCYHVTTAKPYFGRALGILTDMMRHANFPEDRVKSEQGVIHNEMNIGEDDPQRAVSELWNATAFRVHPARYPVIGYPEQFDRLTRDDILSYYAGHYTPENTILSIAGDVSDAQVMQDVSKQLGDWPRGAAHTPALPDEPAQIAPRRAEQSKEVGATYLQIGWHTVPLQSPDLYALDVLAQVLGGGNTGRLVRDLRDKRGLVSEVSVSSDTPNYDAGTFSVSAQLEPSKQVAVEQAVVDAIAQVRNTPISAAELSRAKTSIKSNYLFGKQGVENEAEGAAFDEMATGNPDYSASYVARIGEVTAPEVQAVAQKYLRPEGTTTAIVHPPVAAIQSATEATSPSFAPVLTTLPNGVRLIVRCTTGAPTLSITVMGLGGVRLESASKAGVASVAAQLLTRGTKELSADEIASSVADLGAALDGFSGYNAWGVSSRWLAPDWKRGLTLVSQSVLTPIFPDAEVQNIKAQTLAAIQTQDDDPMSAASRLLRQIYFGAHPYARSQNGTAQSVSALSRADLLSYWGAVLQPKTMVISVVGDIDPAQVRLLAGELFGTFRATQTAPAPPAPLIVLPAFTTRTVARKGVTQSAMFYGFPGVTVGDQDRFALDVLDAALSGASLPGGRIFGRLRDEQLVYDSNAYDSPGIESGMFVVYAASTPANRPRTKVIIEEELARARQMGFAPEELARAKTMCVASHAIDLQTPEQQARAYASDELLGLGFRNGDSYESRINAISNEQVRAAARKYLDENHAALAIVEPAS